MSTGSVVGILVLNYYFTKIVKSSKIKNITYVIILIFLYVNSYGTWGREITNKKFYELSFANIKSNFDKSFGDKKKLLDYEEIK